MAGTDIQVEEVVKTKISEPTDWKVILLNDDVTPMDFVISLLIEVFRHGHQVAHDITMQIHETGSGIAGVFNYEIAEAKMAEAVKIIKANGFPLQVKMEEE